ARDTAERLGELEQIPAGRIDVTTDAIPGRLRITVRRRDPWATPLAHPVLDPASPHAAQVPVPASCRKPLVIGGDPETGDPLPLTLWDEDEGGKVILIAAKKGSGKTVLLSCIRERVTACSDAVLIQVNLSMVRHDRRWAPLAAANALGRTETGRARRILQFIANALFERSEAEGDDRMITPSPTQPLLVVMIDEVDQVAADPICQQLLKTIASKCRNEGGALILAGQRATAQWVGGADLRANIDIAVLGRFARAGEARKATGEEMDLPDMGAYGEGRPGVFLITELGGGGSYHRGRVFNLDQPAAIDQIVAGRLTTRRPYQLEPALAKLAAEWATITSPATDDEDQEEAVPAGDGQLLPGTGQITAKTGQARDMAASDPLAPEIPPGMESHAAQLLAERRRQFFGAYTDVMLPEQEQAALRQLLAAPGGTSTRQAAEVIGRSHMHVSRQFHRWRHEGTTEVRGRGSGRRWHLTPSPGAADPGAGGYPPLRAVPQRPEDTAAGDAQ
ncbi:MAG: hypothetical protein J2P26_07535, partial [Nocardiopsaceae bacterium]|nr:hypothetical protein [Nocardiopsaceae bacterium]